MDFFNSDKLKSMAQSAGKDLKSFGQQAASATQTVANAAKTAAEKAAQDARHAAKDMKQAANQIGNKAGSMVGMTVVVGGKNLYIESLLAEGGFGSVYTAVPIDTDPTKQAVAQEKVVLKRMFAGSRELATQLMNEVRLMKRLIHPNVVRVLAAESRPLPPEGVEILVVMEMCPGGHLLTRLNALKESKKVLPWQKVLDVFLQIVKPVAAMHALEPEPVAHRDLKFENVLIAADGTLRLCDFGSSSSHRGTIADKADRAEQEDAILRYTTPHFRSPEMVDLYSGLPLDVRSDVWALGCMLYGLAYWSHPFQEGGNLAILAARYKLPTSPAYPPPIHTLIRACLQYRPEERPTASQIIAYCESCLKVTAEVGPWPVLHTSGGNSVHSAAIPPPTPGSEQGLPDGSVMITGNSDSGAAGGAGAGAAAGGGGAANKYHAPTAQDILQQVQAQSLANAAATSSKSGALAARLARKGGAPGQAVSAPAPAPAAAPLQQHQPQQAQAAAAPRTASFSSAPAPVPSSGFDGFDAFGASSSGPRAPSPPVPVAPHSAQSGLQPPAGAGFDDFDVFGASSAAPAPAASAARPASGGGLGFDPPVAAPVRAPVPAPAPAPAASDFDDFFSSSGSSSKGGSDLLGMGSGSGAGAVVGGGGVGLGDAFGGLSLGPAPSRGGVPQAQGGVKQQAVVRPQPAAPSPMDDPFNF